MHTNKITAEKAKHKSKLKWEAILNIVADNLATTAYQRLKTTPIKKDQFYLITLERIFLYTNGIPVLKNYREEIINVWASQDL
eukprot:8790767-Ditylum_brightwellii.AAC.1